MLSTRRGNLDLDLGSSSWQTFLFHILSFQDLVMSSFTFDQPTSLAKVGKASQSCSSWLFVSLLWFICQAFFSDGIYFPLRGFPRVHVNF